MKRNQINFYSLRFFFCKNVVKRKMSDDLTIDEVKQRIQCEYCEKTFARGSGGLHAHLEAIHMQKKYPCLDCGAELSSHSALTKHIRSIHEFVRFACELCDYLATDKGNLTRHMRAVHEKLKPFQCAECHLTFSQRQNLLRHIDAIHERIRAFICEICNIRFTRLSSLRQHEKSKQHQLRLMNDDDDDFLQQQRQISTSSTNSTTTTTVAKRFQCDQCTKSYLTAASLQVHVDAVHLMIRYPCKNCPYEATTKGSLAQHVRTVCARKPFRCGRCRKRFPNRDWLIEHKVWHIQVDLERYFKWYELYAYPCFYCSLYFSSFADVCTHIHSSHLNPPFKIIIKRE